MPAPTEISAAQLSRLIGAQDAPALLDVRSETDFAADPRLLPGALRPEGRGPDALAARLAGRKAVLICRHGRGLSQGDAALLRLRGVAAETLEGGVEGWAAAGLPLVPEAAIPPRDEEGRTLWVTRRRPKVDRIACPWLIRRFVDPGARFLFVAAPEVRAVADRLGAEPFDVPGVRFTHRGEGCTFDAMVEDFALDLPALQRLRPIVRGADTDRHDLAPEAAGLLALSLGLSRRHRDDLAQLEAGLALYDALHVWARDAHGEGHDWNPEAAS